MSFHVLFYKWLTKTLSGEMGLNGAMQMFMYLYEVFFPI